MTADQQRFDNLPHHGRKRPRLRRLSALYWLLLCDVAHSASLLDRGQYLVEALMACDNCHTPRSTEGYDYSRRFSGGSQVFTDKDYSVRGSNISPDLES
ncbi:hypothetical protein [Methylocystis bryophila]